MRPLSPALAALLLSGCAAGDLSFVDSSVNGNAALEVYRDLPIPDGARFADDRVVVGFAGEAPPHVLRHDGLALDARRIYEDLQAGIFAVPEGESVEELVYELRESGRYGFVEPDYERTISGGTASYDDPYRLFQWNFDTLDAETAWDTSTGSGILVAVIDTGVSQGNDGLTDLRSGYDFVNGDQDASDDNGHGTHVAGTIGAATENGTGVAGLAHDAAILPVKVMDAQGAGSTADVVDGILYAVNAGADVINLSLGSTVPSYMEAMAVDRAATAGVFVAAASGNSGANRVDFPAAYPGAVAVGATQYDDTVAAYSNAGTDLDVVAPGGNTSLDQNGDGYSDGILQETNASGWGYYFYQGTSMATPHVAAAAALLMSEGATAVEAEDALVDTAVDIEASGWDVLSGAGLIQPVDALDAWAGGAYTDVDPPVISNVQDSHVVGPLYRVSWETDEPTRGEVCDVNYTSCTSSSVLDTSHQVGLRGMSGAEYMVVATDEAGNESTSGPYTF